MASENLIGVHKKNIVGETATATNGMKITCIEDINAKNITVQFEDGSIAYGQRREAFYKGNIKHPSSRTKTQNKRIQDTQEKHIGEKYTDPSGHTYEIIKYLNNANVTIKFDDGTILENREYRAIKNGYNLYPTSIHGKIIHCRNGLNAKIIKWDSKTRRYIVEFEDGYRTTAVTNQIQNAAIKHPKVDARKENARRKIEGTTLLQKDGLKATCVRYNGYYDCDFIFENGMKSDRHSIHPFRNQTLPIPHHINKIRILQFLTIKDDKWYYVCKHINWDKPRIMSVPEMYEYKEETNDEKKI